MSLNGLTWPDTNACDIHLLPGLVSPQLKQLLRPDNFDPKTGVTVVDTFSNMSGVTVSFVAQFAGAPDNHGVKLNKDTGEVAVASALPAGPRLRSFIVTASAKEGAVTVTARIRIYVHGSISKIWLTPAQLTVRKDAKNMRFSVLAQFDDLTIGDITNWSPFNTPGSAADFVHAAGSDKALIDWSVESIPAGGTAVVDPNPVTGELRATAESGSAKVTAKLLGKTASAIVLCAKPWSTPLTLTHVSGPGAREASFVPNLLFLPDGFQEKEKTEYERLVRFVIGRLSNRNRTRPFSALTGRLNYFYGWIPSPDPGVSVLNELDRRALSATTAEGDALESPSPGRGPAGRWSLENLINEVGLPTPASDPIISVLDAAKIDAWQKLYGPQVTKARMEHLFAEWLKRNDRVILNERDTAFHMAFGSKPGLDVETPSHGLKFNPRRLTYDDFNTFLKNLKGPTGLGLPDIWSAKGKDSKLIVILCRSNRVGGLNDDRNGDGSTVGVSLGRLLPHRMEDNKLGNGFDLKPDTIPTDPNYDIWLTVAHELGHSCGLGDEYGGEAGAPTPAELAATAKYANLHDSAALFTQGVLIVDNVKWREWPRIAKAGVLIANPKPAGGGKFQLILHDIKASGIRPGDIVRLRTRPLAKALPPTARFKVESVTTTDMVIAPLFGATLDPAKFPPDSIVMVPVREKDPNPAANIFGGDLTLVNADVLKRMLDTGNPFNAQPLAGEAPPPNDKFTRPCKNVELKTPTPATNFPGRTAPKPPQYSSWTIGIYENGLRHNCGVYRPTGICLMSVNAHKDPKTLEVNMYDYCLICRYAIIDALDPTRHEAVDVDFMERYGRRGRP